MRPMKFGIGQAVKRVEDSRLLTGRGRYTDDIVADGALRAFVLRSPHAHAAFRIADVSTARATAGVLAVLTAADLGDAGGLPCLAPLRNSDGSDMPLPPYPLLARGHVMHVGDAVALIVAETELAAREGAEAIVVDYDVEPSVIDMRAALAPGAVEVWPQAKGNVAYDTHVGDEAACDAAFASAARVVRLDVVNQRLIANFMEPRGALGQFDARSGRFTLTVSSQGVHGLQESVAGVLGIEPGALRVVTPDVGGGFGTKSFIYREYPLVLLAAKMLGRPVKWIADRSDHFLGDAQGRDNLTHLEMALDADAKFLALRVDILGGLGAYLSQFGPYIPWLGASMATGPYDIPALHARVRGVYTHTIPVDAYRGAGRPEAAYALERLVDACAAETGVPREELRARNFAPPSRMPFKTQTDRTYDVGEFEAAMRQALRSAEWAGFPARAAEAKRRGRIRGAGFASYIECTAWGEGETGSITLGKDGDFEILIGTQSNGQGHETAYAQTAAQFLDVPPERIRVIQGDTDRVVSGAGTGGSRSIPVGSAMVARASEKLVTQLKELASDALEAAIADLEVADGRIRVAGTDRSIGFGDIAALPAATPGKLGATGSFTPPEATYPNGTHVCEVEIDPETGTCEIARYTICDDFGLTLNPMLLAGQVHGGAAQGVGQALMEQAVFGADGQLLTASFMDYCMPRAADLPSFAFETRNVPSTTNPLGLKGAGEAGSIGSTPAVMNAIGDALRREYGVAHIDMPATPAAIHAAIAAARR